MSPSLLPPQQRPWVSLVVSALVHGLVVVLAVVLTRQSPPEQPPEDPARQEAERRRRVEMLYLPPQPPPPAVRRPPPPPVTPPPPTRQPEPEPAPNAPPDAERSTGAEEPAEDGRSETAATGTTSATAPAKAPAAEKAATTAPTMESEARRIFGRTRPGAPPGAGPLATRPMASDVTPTKCIIRPKPPRDSAAAPQMGIVVGQIFRRDNGQPLPGAFLQMIGTPFVTFTDDDGVYRFKFDLSLVDDCRTQYVRVTAKDYESQLLVLVVGENVQNEDILLRRR